MQSFFLFGLLLLTLNTAWASDLSTALDEHKAFLAEAYAGGEHIWLEGGELNSRAKVLKKFLDSAAEQGLKPSDYVIPSEANLSKVDVMLTLGLVKYVSDLKGGRLALKKANSTLYAGVRHDPAEYPEILKRARESKDLAAFLSSEAPLHPLYKKFRKALKREKDPGRAGQLIANMERLRWLSFGDRRLDINLATTGLELFEGGRRIFKTDFTLGEQYLLIPVQSFEINRIEFNPYWNISPRVARNDFLPILKKSPHLLKEQHIQVFLGWGPGSKELSPKEVDWSKVEESAMFKYRLRQSPGPQNKLGVLKFLFKNRSGAYLHGSPGKAPKDKKFPTCIWLREPGALALELLPGWEKTKLSQLLESREYHREAIQVPLNILYLTITPELKFLEDSFGRDRMLLEVLG